MPDLLTKGSALFSDCRKYRYDLCRVWDDKAPLFLIIMLNPSTADAMKDDPTTRKCLHYAREAECGQYVAVNLFSFRSPLPKVMMKAADPIGPDNDQHLIRWLKVARKDRASMVVVAWGNDGSHLNRDAEILDIISQQGHLPLCFGTNKNGSPKHPTYLANNLNIRLYYGKTQNDPT